MTIKYVSDLTTADVIVDRHSRREIVIDYLEPVEDSDSVLVFGYFEDNGDEWTRTLRLDSEVKVK